MSAPLWSRDALRALAADAKVSVLDTTSRPVEVPVWLSEVAEGVTKGVRAVESYRRDDRERLIMLYIRALERPGELLEASGVADIGDQPYLVETAAVNLCHQPDVGGILFCSRGRPIEPHEVPRSNAEQRGPATNWMLLTLDENAVIRSIEGRAEEILGHRPAEMLGTRPVDHLPAEDQPATIRLWIELLTEPDRLLSIQGPWNHKDGTLVWLECTYVLRSSAPAGEAKALVAVWDITKRIEAENRLRESESNLRRMAEDLRVLADEVPSAVFRCDARGAVSFHNARWDEMLSGRAEPERLHDLVLAADHTVLDELLSDVGRAGCVDRRHVEVRSVDETTWLRLGLRAVETGAEHRSYIGSLEDVTATVQLRTDASHDPLTGLLNRAAIETRVTEVDREGDELDIVAFIDLDDFKDVNDSYGHHVGDLVLVEVAQRLLGAVRHGDVAGRWGGDEFVLVCRDVTDDALSILAERLRSSTRRPIGFDGGSLRPSISVGFARPLGDGVSGLLRRADEQMFEDKRRRTSN